MEDRYIWELRPVDAYIFLHVDTGYWLGLIYCIARGVGAHWLTKLALGMSFLGGYEIGVCSWAQTSRTPRGPVMLHGVEHLCKYLSLIHIYTWGSSTSDMEKMGSTVHTGIH